MDSHAEFDRRRRIFRRVLRTTFALEALVLVGYFTHLLGGEIAFAALMISATAGLGWMRWGLRWTQAVQPAVELTAAAAPVYDAARQRFVRRRGTIGFGLTWGVTMSIATNWHELVVRPWSARLLLLGFMLLLWLPVGALAGWIWGRIMWQVFTPKVTRPTDTSSGGV